MTALALAVRFLLELAAFAALAWWGWTQAVVLAVALPAGAIALWGAFGAPKARWLSPRRRLAVEVAVFGGAAAALAAGGHPAFALAFAVVAVADGVGVRMMR